MPAHPLRQAGQSLLDAFAEHQRAGSRPAAPRQPPAEPAHLRQPGQRLRHARKRQGQRLALGPAFARTQTLDAFFRLGTGRHAVNRLGREGHEFPAREGLHRLVQDLTPIQARLPCDDFGHFLRALADRKFGGKPCLREMCTLQGTRRPDKTARLKAEDHLTALGSARERPFQAWDCLLQRQDVDRRAGP